MQGVINKYHITKTDGSPVDPEADYFVLRLDTDSAARLAMVYYADAIMEDNPTLARELMARVCYHDNRAGKDA